jgi:hypothetical protein
VVEWLILLLRIQEVSGLELGPETGNPDWGVSWFFSRSLQTNVKMATNASFHVLSNLSFTCHPIIYAIIWITEKVSLKKMQINK